MKSDAATARPRDGVADLTERAIDTTFDFVRAAAADPVVFDEVPDGAMLVLVPADDPVLAAAEIEQGLAALGRGHNVYFRHVRRDESPIERTWDEANDLDQRYAAVWTRLKNGELTPAEAKRQSLAVLEQASSDAVHVSTRRRRVRADTLRDQAGVDPSPASTAILALLDEVVSALESGSSASIDWDDANRRMADHLAALRREVDGS